MSMGEAICLGNKAADCCWSVAVAMSLGSLWYNRDHRNKLLDAHYIFRMTESYDHWRGFSVLGFYFNWINNNEGVDWVWVGAMCTPHFSDGRIACWRIARLLILGLRLAAEPLLPYLLNILQQHITFSSYMKDPAFKKKTVKRISL